MEGEIVNRVDQSGLVSIDMEAWYSDFPYVIYDIKQNLFQELILREKEFRTFLKEKDWTEMEGKYVFLVCTADAIVPTWAYMLLAGKLQNVAKSVEFTSEGAILEKIFKKIIAEIEVEKYRNQKVVVKGCSKVDVPVNAYVELTNKLQPVVQSLMFGEPCSTVPIYKKMK